MCRKTWRPRRSLCPVRIEIVPNVFSTFTCDSVIYWCHELKNYFKEYFQHTFTFVIHLNPKLHNLGNLSVIFHNRGRDTTQDVTVMKPWVKSLNLNRELCFFFSFSLFDVKQNKISEMNSHLKNMKWVKVIASWNSNGTFLKYRAREQILKTSRFLF